MVKEKCEGKEVKLEIQRILGGGVYVTGLNGNGNIVNINHLETTRNERVLDADKNAFVDYEYDGATVILHFVSKDGKQLRKCVCLDKGTKLSVTIKLPPVRKKTGSRK